MTRKIVVGVGGGIAAYKTASLVSGLVQDQHTVDVVLTRSAVEFIGPATFTALCGRPAVTETHDARFPLGPHIELADKTDLLIVAPATARLLASFAHGLGDDLLATLYLACRCSVLVAPAMNSAMWDAPAVQRNVLTLQEDGIHFVGPESGWLSCRQHGYGRMSEPADILAAANKLLG